MYPRDKLTPEEIDRTDSAIRQVVGPGVEIEKAIGAKGHPKEFLIHWYGYLSEEQLVEVGELDGVCHPRPRSQGTSCHDGVETDIIIQISEVQKDEIDPWLTFEVMRDGCPGINHWGLPAGVRPS